MNVFILNSGRCGSTTFVRACAHIHNYSAAHESRASRIGPERLAYPANHIEADNRLCWVLGRLDAAYGDDALYVHLTREREATAQSFARRFELEVGIMPAYRDGILMGGEAGQTPLAIAHDYLDTIDANIALFLRDKTRKMDFRLEQAEADFACFWEMIGAEGDKASALAQWQVRYNASV